MPQLGVVVHTFNGSRGRQISDLEASLVCRVSSRTPGISQADAKVASILWMRASLRTRDSSFTNFEAQLHI